MSVGMRGRSLGRMLHRSNSTIAIIQYVTIPGGPPLINITGDNSFAIDRKMRRARGIATVRVLVMAEGWGEAGEEGVANWRLAICQVTAERLE